MVLDVEVLGSFGQTRVSRDFNAGLRIFVQWNARGRCDFALPNVTVFDQNLSNVVHF